MYGEDCSLARLIELEEVAYRAIAGVEFIPGLSLDIFSTLTTDDLLSSHLPTMSQISFF